MKKSELRQIIKEELIKEWVGFSVKDSILSAITFEELIDTLQSNEQNIDERAVKRVFDEILKANTKDAYSILNKQMKTIIILANK